MLLHLLRDESGATAIEYALISALIAMVIIGAIAAVGGAIKASFFDSVANNLPG